ncbi:MobA/MobL family protein [Sphingomonas sp. BK481]|uniref:MobA/MobL family protein n=1 Tax=Sphingomonas sp. BK481 TaxID=2586981 RepID=UPI001612A064|nr:MobA/MobL family protein [Sphingomonas sp. BK481]MBB3588981.1 hypothetical protein [Sphingomonas sp. BK481]
MAVYHFHARIIRRSVGRSVIAASAWQNACRLRDERLGRFSDFVGDRTVGHSTILLPDTAPSQFGDREALWNAVEFAEIRKDAQLARQYDLSLPDEFDRATAIDVLRRFAIDNIAAAGFPVDLTLIEVTGAGEPTHCHGYLLFPTRPINAGRFDQKPREWNTRQKLTALRAEWANILNARLEAVGSDARVDHRSNKDRGVPKERSAHIGIVERRIIEREITGVRR